MFSRASIGGENFSANPKTATRAEVLGVSAVYAALKTPLFHEMAGTR
jgi:hypothetical protein